MDRGRSLDHLVRVVVLGQVELALELKKVRVEHLRISLVKDVVLGALEEVVIGGSVVKADHQFIIEADPVVRLVGLLELA